MDKLRLLTKDGRLLTMLRIGEIGSDKGSDKITCLDKNKNQVDITFQDVQLVFGTYSFFNYSKGKLG